MRVHSVYSADLGSVVTPGMVSNVRSFAIMTKKTCIADLNDAIKKGCHHNCAYCLPALFKRVYISEKTAHVHCFELPGHLLEPRHLKATLGRAKALVNILEKAVEDGTDLTKKPFT